MSAATPWLGALKKLAWLGAVGLVGVATLTLGISLGPAGAVAPVLLLGCLFLIAQLPLRYVVWTVVFLTLVLDNPADMGPWKSPFFMLGQFLSVQMKWSIPIPALVLTGADGCLLLCFLLLTWRRLDRNPIDSLGATPLPRALGLFAWLTIFGAMVSLVWGVIHGGQLKWANWQLDRVLRLPLWMLFFSAVLRGSKDIRAIGRLLVSVGLLRALLAIGVRQAFPTTETATSHADSMVLATGAAILVIAVLEQPNPKTLRRALLLLPIFAWGMVANDRRIVWANLIVALFFVFVLSRWSPLKKSIVRLGLWSIPVGLLYVGAGWNSGSRIFKPVATIRSMVDAKSDASSNWREVENFNLHYTFLENPFMGTGWGRPFIEIQPLPHVPYELEPYVPHNSVLGLWAYTGFVGFTCIWMILAVGVHFSLLAYRSSATELQRMASLSCFAALIICMLQAFGDMGLGSWPWGFILGMAIPMAGKIALENGAWPRGRRLRS